ncbi:hypothetical protein ACQRIU_000166 [Beauveria bassiana]
MLRPGVVYGGVPLVEQVNQLNRGCDVLIGTPGRLVAFGAHCRTDARIDHANFPLPTPTTTTSASFVKPFAVRPSPTGGIGAFVTRALLPNEVAVRPSPTGGMGAFTTTTSASFVKPFAVRPSPTGGIGAFVTRALLPNEVAVRPSPTGGMGAFTTRALLPNEVILEEKPLFTSTRGDSIFKALPEQVAKSKKRQ